MSLPTLDAIRRFYAEEICVVGNLQSEALTEAFATVPRERFLGSGPWYYTTPEVLSGEMRYRKTEDDDPRHLYHNVPVIIDAERHLPNGQPSTVGFFIDRLDLKAGDSVLHVGCGTGYFSAIIAEVVGAGGQVTAIDIEKDLADRAGQNLSYLPQAKVVSGDGSTYDSGPVDAILVNAGATSPLALWLDNLKPGGRLIVPLTINHGPKNMGSGMVLKAIRDESGYTAYFISPVMIYHCFGTRDEEANNRVRTMMMQGKWNAVRSIRRDAHEIMDSCCLHGDGGICLSSTALGEKEEDTREAI